MAALAGALRRDGAPSSGADVHAMCARLRHRRETSLTLWRTEPVVLAHLAHVELDDPPCPAAPGSFLDVSFAGRLDNREEFPDFQHLSDAELVARAYERHGDAFLQRLVGDFALALWDRRRRRLICARDVLGVKPFYYTSNAHVFRFASEIAALLAPGDVDPAINDAMVAEYLACRITSPTDTLYAHVHRLPAAHALEVTEDHVRTWRYWSIDGSRRIRCADDREYAEGFREVFEKAVRARLRGARRVGVTLSGGIDSSSVVAMAAHIVRGSAPAVAVHGFSLVFGGRSCDEREYIEAVERGVGVPVHCEAGVPPDLDEAAEYSRLFADFPGYPNFMMFDRLRRSAASLGFQVMLTGEGGDDWFGGSYYHYADLIRERRWRDLYTQWRADRSICGPSAIEFPRFPLLRLGVLPLISPPLRRLARSIAPRRDAAPAWMNQALARRVNLPARFAKRSMPADGSIAERHQIAALESGVDTHYFEICERGAARSGVEERHPLSDRRVVEFAFSLPESQRWQGRYTKYVVRNAMRGLVPDAVLRRVSKADFSFAYAETMRSVAPDGRAWSGAWTNRTTLAAMHRQMEARYAADDEGYTSDIWPLWMATGIGLWQAAAIRRPEEVVA